MNERAGNRKRGEKEEGGRRRMADQLNATIEVGVRRRANDSAAPAWSSAKKQARKNFLLKSNWRGTDWDQVTWKFDLKLRLAANWLPRIIYGALWIARSLRSDACELLIASHSSLPHPSPIPTLPSFALLSSVPFPPSPSLSSLPFLSLFFLPFHFLPSFPLHSLSFFPFIPFPPVFPFIPFSPFLLFHSLSSLSFRSLFSLTFLFLLSSALWVPPSSHSSNPGPLGLSRIWRTGILHQHIMSGPLNMAAGSKTKHAMTQLSDTRERQLSFKPPVGQADIFLGQPAPAFFPFFCSSQNVTILRRNLTFFAITTSQSVCFPCLINRNKSSAINESGSRKRQIKCQLTAAQVQLLISNGNQMKTQPKLTLHLRNWANLIYCQMVLWPFSADSINRRCMLAALNAGKGAPFGSNSIKPQIDRGPCSFCSSLSLWLEQHRSEEEVRVHYISCQRL